jgi:hypothetical protein
MRYGRKKPENGGIVIQEYRRHSHASGNDVGLKFEDHLHCNTVWKNPYAVSKRQNVPSELLVMRPKQESM